MQISIEAILVAGVLLACLGSKVNFIFKLDLSRARPTQSKPLV